MFRIYSRPGYPHKTHVINLFQCKYVDAASNNTAPLLYSEGVYYDYKITCLSCEIKYCYETLEFFSGTTSKWGFCNNENNQTLCCMRQLQHIVAQDEFNWGDRRGTHAFHASTHITMSNYMEWWSIYIYIYQFRVVTTFMSLQLIVKNLYGPHVTSLGIIATCTLHASVSCIHKFCALYM